MNKKIWTHLSNHILSCHVTFGNFVPGMQSRVVMISNQMKAKIIVETFFFNADLFPNINKKGALKEGPCH